MISEIEATERVTRSIEVLTAKDPDWINRIKAEDVRTVVGVDNCPLDLLYWQRGINTGLSDFLGIDSFLSHRLAFVCEDDEDAMMVAVWRREITKLKAA